MIRLLLTSVGTWPVSQRLVFRWRGSHLLRAVGMLAGGTVLAQVLSVMSAPITTRLYGPADYGMASVFSSVVGVLLLFATWRYEMAIVLPQDEEAARAVLWACFALAGSASLIAIPLTWWFGYPVFAALGVPQLYRYWWMLPPTILGGALYQCLSIWALRRKDYRALSGSKVRQAAAGSLVSIAMGCLWKGPFGLLLGAFCWMSLGVGRLGRGTLRGEAKPAAVRAATRIKAALRAYFNFALLTTGATFLNSAGTLITPMLFSTCYSQETVGHFSLAMRIVSLPGTLIATAVAQVFIAEASDMNRERPHELPAFFRKVTLKMAPLALGLLLAGAVCPWAFPVLFGARWEMAGIFAALLAVLASAQLIVSPISDVAVLRQKQALQFGLGAARTVVVLVTIWLPHRLGLSALCAVGCYTTGMSLMSGVAYWFYARVARELSSHALLPCASA